jgi:hypothetical protein
MRVGGTVKESKEWCVRRHSGRAGLTRPERHSRLRERPTAFKTKGEGAGLFLWTLQRDKR